MMMLYLLNNEEEIQHIVPVSKINGDVYQESELNGVTTLTFSLSIEDSYLMNDIFYVVHKDVEDRSKFYQYRIISETNDADNIEYTCIYTFNDDLTSYGYIKDKRPNKVKASQALEIVLDGTNWSVGLSDDSSLASLNFYDSTRLDALSTVLKTYNMEVETSISALGNKLINRTASIKKQIGNETGKRFFYGTNALEVVREVNNQDLATKFIGRGKGEEKFDDEGIETDGYGRKITIEDVSWNKSNGDPIDKPKGQEYIELENLTKLYGFPDGEPRTEIVEFSEIEDPEILIEALYQYALDNSRPQVSYKANITDIGRVSLGDSYLIIRKDIDIRYITRVYKIKRNLKDYSQTVVELGDNIEINQGLKNKNMIDKLNSLQDDLRNNTFTFTKIVQNYLTESIYNEESYRYEAKPDNNLGLLSGTWYFNKPMENDPDKALYLGSGKIAIANKKDSDGNWEFTTWATGDGLVADAMVLGILRGGKVKWNLEDGTFIIGEDVSDYSMYWDGSTLHLRDVDIDLENNDTIQGIKQQFELGQGELKSTIEDEVSDLNSKISQTSNRIDLKVSKNDIISAINLSPERIQIDSDKLNIDVSKLDLNVDEVTTTWSRYSSKKAIHIEGPSIELYNESGYVAGGITTGNWIGTSINNIRFAHYPSDGTMTISYKSGSVYNPYITFDKYGMKNSYPITVHQDVDFGYSNIIFNNDMRIARQFNGISIENRSGDGFLFGNDGHMYRYDGGSKGTKLF